GTGKEQQIRIQASGGLSDADIEQMVKDAESHAEEDKKRRESVEAKNQAESMVHATEKQLAEHGDKLSDADKNTIELAVADTKEAIESGDPEAINEKAAALTQAAMKLGEAIYAASQEDTDHEVSGESGDDVVDADFEEVKDDDEKKSA
ncbi:MAG: Hsp70 family protein, partial [Rhodobiaceae bacterium]|nr:Hsp70 family protein [Rhodobiaceae bacterium]